MWQAVRGEGRLTVSLWVVLTGPQERIRPCPRWGGQQVEAGSCPPPWQWLVGKAHR